MRAFVVCLSLILAGPALAQGPAVAGEEEIVVTGLRDGSKLVEVEFDKVWRNCAECKRALAKLDLLAKDFHDETETMKQMSQSRHQNDRSPPSTIGTFQRSSNDLTPTTVGGLATARAMQRREVTSLELTRKYVAPERAKMMVHMRSFLDQLAPHVVAAAEEERKLRGAKASLIGKRNAKISAKRVVRIDVTDAVIKRLDAKPFTIALPDPAPSRSAARKRKL